MPTGADGIEVGVGIGVSVDVGIGMGVSVEVGVGMGVSVDVGIDAGISVDIDSTVGVDSISVFASADGLVSAVEVDLMVDPVPRPQASERLSRIARKSTFIFFIVYLQDSIYSHSERS
jgi:hypothetical protein